ncbi:MAG: class I SAM-dependent methyltransferase [Candidatus Eremiobacterota bacterium]
MAGREAVHHATAWGFLSTRRGQHILEGFPWIRFEQRRVQIPVGDVRFDPTSYVDPHGRLFQWQDRLYRGIRPESADFFRALIGGRRFQSFVESGRVVETRFSEHELEGFALVLEHRTIWPRTYCVEWPPQMLQDAALLTLDLARELAEEDLVLQDAYPWNVLFDGARAVFVDVGSIRTAVPGLLWQPYEQFCRFFLFPLYLYAAGLGELVRPMLFNYLGGVSYELCSRLLSGIFKLTHPQTLSRLEFPLGVSRMVRTLKAEAKVREASQKGQMQVDWSRARRNLFRGLYRDVQSIRLRVPRTEWSDYQEWPSFDDPASWTIKQRHIGSLYEKLQPESVVDVACNLGWYATLAARRGVRVVAFDQDESCVSKLYLSARQENLPLTPLCVDALRPTPSFGWNLEQFPSLLQRVRGDMVVALALIHHLVITQWQSFERVVTALSSLTQRCLVLEYVPLTDEMARKLLSYQRESFDWYTLDNLAAALKARFSEVEVLPSHPEGRQLLVATR